MDKVIEHGSFTDWSDLNGVPGSPIQSKFLRGHNVSVLISYYYEITQFIKVKYRKVFDFKIYHYFVPLMLDIIQITGFSYIHMFQKQNRHS